ncbi:MAG TPA: hypothetical protein VFY92_06780, partial [Hyphomicrobiaceae bacterium]|nr:hypothetical protein [Hyphomicrobiaceae bacterium]
MEALGALLDRVSHGLAAAFAAAPLAWALAVAGLLLALVVVAVRLRAGPRNEIDAVYLMSAAATRKAREISELDAFARRVNAASDELKQQIRKLRAGHHT